MGLSASVCNHKPPVKDGPFVSGGQVAADQHVIPACRKNGYKTVTDKLAAHQSADPKKAVNKEISIYYIGIFK